jgi:hypothetical protein
LNAGAPQPGSGGGARREARPPIGGTHWVCLGGDDWRESCHHRLQLQKGYRAKRTQAAEHSAPRSAGLFGSRHQFDRTRRVPETRRCWRPAVRNICPQVTRTGSSGLPVSASMKAATATGLDVRLIGQSRRRGRGRRSRTVSDPADLDGLHTRGAALGCAASPRRLDRDLRRLRAGASSSS